MTNRSKGDGKSGVREGSEVIRKLNTRAEQLLAKPDLVHDALDDAVFVQAFVWSTLFPKFLLHCQKQNWREILGGTYTIYKTEAFLEPLNFLAVLFDSIIAGDLKTESSLNEGTSFGLDDTAKMCSSTCELLEDKLLVHERVRIQIHTNLISSVLWCILTLHSRQPSSQAAFAQVTSCI
jgi:hypothetical protein